MAAVKYKVLSPFLGSSKVLHHGETIEEKDVKAGDLKVKLSDGHLEEVNPSKKEEKKTSFFGK